MSVPRPPRAPRPRRSQSEATPRGETRQRIVAAALRIFAAQGFDGAKTRDIAKAAGVNQGLITYHFASKDLLWKEAVDSIFAELQSELGGRFAALEDVDAVARLRAMVKHFVRFSAARPELHRLIVWECTRDSLRMRWLIDRHVRPLYEVSTELIRAAQRAGHTPRMPPTHLHYMLVGAATHLFLVAPEYRRLTGADPTERASVEAHAEAVAAALIDEGPAPRRVRRRAR